MILLKETEQAERVSLAPVLKMNHLLLSMIGKVLYPWLMLEKTPMGHNFS